MPTLKKLVGPSKDELARWFNTAHSGDQCRVMTEEGEIYTHLTKLSPSIVKWQVSGFTDKDTQLSSTMRFAELLETWNDFAVH